MLFGDFFNVYAILSFIQRSLESCTVARSMACL
jgi:hypothetical protein